jgi:hypothetical protein
MSLDRQFDSEMNMCKRLLIVVAFLSVCWVASRAQTADDVKHFVGTWRLVSITENGKPVPVRGLRPTGVWFVDAKGNFSVQIMPDRVRPSWSASSEPTGEQAKAALVGYSAIFGSFSVDTRAHSITYHVTGGIEPGNVGVDLVRQYEFARENRVVITPRGYPDRRFTWARVQ